MKNKKVLSIVIISFFLSLTSIIYFFNAYGTSSDTVQTATYNDVYEQDNEEGTKISQPEPIVKDEKTTLSIAATGDIMFHTTQLRGAYSSQNKTYDFKNVFSKVKKHIEAVDIALANFETVTAGSEYRYTGFPTFNSPYSTVEALKHAGFDILSTANNHSIDKGKKGIVRTIDNINKYGLKNVGTYKQKDKDILIENINDINIAFLSYTYGCNGLESRLTEDELSFMVNLIDEEKIKNEIKKAEEESDAVLVFMHWGNEYQRKPSKFQKDLAMKMIEWGADIILGSHPHVIQESEIVNHEGEDKFIIYSMGNFISNQRRETLSFKNRIYTEDGIIVKIIIEKNITKDKTVIKDVNYVPTWVHRYRSEGRYKYEILPVDEYLQDEEMQLTQEVMAKLEQSYHNTMDLMYVEEDLTEN